MSIRVLSGADVRAALPMPEAIKAMRAAFLALHRGQVTVPDRTNLPVNGGPNAALFMPAAATDPVMVGSKMLTLFPANPGKGRPFIHGVVVLFNPKTGQAHGILEGTTLTALRTGAVCGVATRLMARRTASRLAIIGAGTQARTMLEAVCCVRPIREVRVYARRHASATAFAREMSGHPGVTADIRVCDSAADAAADADIICTATPATRPVIGIGDVKTGVHINAVGSFTPKMREIGAAIVHDARVVVDSRRAALTEAGELIDCLEKGSIDSENLLELGELLAGDHAGRESPEQITLFKSVGLAAQDLFAADRALRRAHREGIGQEVAF